MAPIFQTRQERLDWQLIAELEPLVLVSGSPEEIEKLQAVLAGLAFCSLEQEFGREMLEGTRGLAKIFRLSQLVIQYLMYCQDQLSRNIEKHNQRERQLEEDLLNTTDRFQALEAEVKALRKETKKRKKMLTMQQESMFKDKDFREFRKCPVCPKVFVNDSFLSSHLKRRHKEIKQESLAMMSEPQQFVQSNRDDLKELLEDIKSYFPKTKSEDYALISELVKSQQEQINQLHSMFNNRPERREPAKYEVEGSKLQAQEILWQSKIKAVEESFAKSLLESEEKLRNLQTDFEIEKEKVKKVKRRERRKQRREARLEGEKEPEPDGNNSDGNKPTVMPSSDNSPKSLAKLEVSEVETNDDSDSISQASASQEEQSEVNEKQIKKVETKDDQEPDFPLQKTLSSVSLKSEHMYEAPLSFKSSKENILELIDKNPSRIDQYRSQVKRLLSDQLEQLGVDSRESRMSDEDFSLHMRQIKDYRRRVSNSSEIGDLRSRYKEEVDALASQSSLKHGSLKKRLSKGMSSFRKQIFRSLQNLNSTNHQQRSSFCENLKKKKSPKKKLAPPPPPPPQSSLKKASSNDSCSPKPDQTSNIYVESPCRLPPKPAPRASKITKVVERCPTPSSSSSEDSEEEFEQHIDIGGQMGNIINTIEVHRNEDSEDEEDTFDEVENLSDNNSVTEDVNEGNDSENRDIADRTGEENETDVEDEDTAADDKTFSWDSEDNIEEIENVDLNEEKKTEIKLMRPKPGSKIADLTNIIECQLYRRAGRPTGGVDPLQAAMERCEEEISSTNTLPTSQWQADGSHTSRPCSATTAPSLTSRPASALLAPPAQRRRVTSWDSD